ncbi:hypothetical protein M427DRAFT_324121 [Gonapodya prolifera JEL478]|uniref:Uncharacterized protein n=1 Tax=Gonapodya prolifera (strain JEL478) TaxID=1344416 RepID=A0A139AG09_GONPJ|nr:hypothetical protein M427DRAFT_324121 [Gonapodya prolifera JEL478]|eukprot:KXS15365.1 hypothetical protein M427DRAFT_324121 [Gonapodya prolifera JEL478]
MSGNRASTRQPKRLVTSPSPTSHPTDPLPALPHPHCPHLHQPHPPQYATQAPITLPPSRSVKGTVPPRALSRRVGGVAGGSGWMAEGQTQTQAQAQGGNFLTHPGVQTVMRGERGEPGVETFGIQAREDAGDTGSGRR